MQSIEELYNYLSKYYYRTTNYNKYPMGFLTKTKEEIQNDIIKYPEIAVYYMKECNIPYIPYIWKNLVDRCNNSENDLRKAFGKYIAKMKLASFKNYTWEDTDDLVEREDINGY